MPIKHGKDDPFLDLVFVLDCTGSMGPYIAQAEEKIKEISQRIFASKLLADPEDLRVGIVAYRDYAPQDFQEWTTKRFPFTSDMETIKGYLSELTAKGGGDGPEAVATALYEATYQMAWRPDRGAKVIVLITDAAPHGMNPRATSGDGFPKGDPHPDPKLNPFTPALILQKLKSEDVHVLTIQCEPTLTNYYKLGANFYKGLAKITNGRNIPLGNSEILADSIIVFALETLDLGRILKGLGGAEMAKPSHPQFKVTQLFRAVTDKQLSDAEVEDQLAKLYENPSDDLGEQIDRLTTKKSPDEAIKELRLHLKDHTAHSCSTNVKHDFSAEGLYNIEMFMRAHTTGTLDGELKEDTKTCLVGDCAKQTISIQQKSLTDGQIKRLAHMYASRYDH